MDLLESWFVFAESQTRFWAFNGDDTLKLLEVAREFATATKLPNKALVVRANDVAGSLRSGVLDPALPQLRRSLKKRFPERIRIQLV